MLLSKNEYKIVVCILETKIVTPTDIFVQAAIKVLQFGFRNFTAVKYAVEYGSSFFKYLIFPLAW
jgi:hypothetical protein